MSWLRDLKYVLTHKKNVNMDDVKHRVMAGVGGDSVELDTEDLAAYVADIDVRVKNMVKDLKKIYKPYNITFTGFKSFDNACEYLKKVVNNNNEEAYNNLIKLESMVTSEQQRHLALIRMAVSPDGKRVIDQINQNPQQKEIFAKIFGERGATGKIANDGLYQRLWSEIHKLSEYLLIKKNRIYH